MTVNLDMTQGDQTTDLDMKQETMWHKSRRRYDTM